MESIQVFDPVDYSTKENEFLLEVLGEPPVVVARKVTPGVNPRAIMPIINRVYELMELEKHEGQSWVGIDPMKSAIRTFLDVSKKWAEDAKRSRLAPRWPSLYSFDAKGRAHKGAPGSDSGKIKTYFDQSGQRVPFAIELIPDNRPDWVAPTIADAPRKGSYVALDEANHRWECRIPVGEGLCGHTETFRTDSRSSKNVARGRMSKHLRRATENAEMHREVHSLEFGE